MLTSESQLSKNNPRIKVLYLYTGLNRSSLFEPVAKGIIPNSAFRGYFELKNAPALDVSLFDLSGTLNQFPPLVKKIFPNDVLYLFSLPKVLSYDCVIASEVYLLGLVASFYGKLARKPKWIYVPINSSVLVTRHKRNFIKRFSLSVFWRSFSRIAYITESQRKDFVKLGVKNGALVYVPFGVDVNFFNSTYKDSDDDYVLSIGRDLGRDFSALFRVAKLLPYKFIVATSPSNVPEGSDIPDNVLVYYNLSPEEIRMLYKKARIVALFLDEDGSVKGSDCTGQTVMLEALSASRPVFATNRAWIGEYFKEGQEYYAVPKGSDAEIAQTLTSLWNDADLRFTLSRNGYQAVTREYSSSAYASRLERLIHDLHAESI